MIIASPAAQEFVKGLNAKHGDYGVFDVMPGRRFDRITIKPHNSTQTFVHAFVEASTGHIFKAAGWKAPAKGARYLNVSAALEKADRYGSYLYAR